ncbi:hypothetical protein [Plantactinospora sonchi]|uniref:HEAT repeat domain-containing protein n=1 Tax=Plantactinospora sonchi TaxID=1544735 RepID=A0ABU7RME8_9ACTN
MTDAACRILEDTDWSGLEHAYGPACPETPTTLAGLVSGEPDAVRIALNHLSDELIHQTTLFSATVPAALYVAALVSDPECRESVTPGWETGRYPLRAKLLDWLEAIAYEISDSKVEVYRSWGFSEAEALLLYPGVRQIRPTLFPYVVNCLDDPDLRVRRAAVRAAVRLADCSDLASHRELLAPLVRDVLVVSAEEEHRRLAINTLEAWGEDVEPLRSSVTPIPPAVPERAPEGPFDEPPF